jgi:hypothetical protein
MSNRIQKLDFVAELRLRQWARRNYVLPSERRDSDWHAVVLDEMRLVDRDRLLPGTIEGVVTSTGPASLQRSRHEGIRTDEPHADIPSPRIRQTTDAQTETRAANYA